MRMAAEARTAPFCSWRLRIVEDRYGRAEGGGWEVLRGGKAKCMVQVLVVEEESGTVEFPCGYGAGMCTSSRVGVGGFDAYGLIIGLVVAIL